MSEKDHEEKKLPLALGITGASGAIYGVRLLQRLLDAGRQVHLVISDAGRIVLKEELSLSGKDLGKKEHVTLHGNGEIGACVASGSFRLAGTIICPCSANTRPWTIIAILPRASLRCSFASAVVVSANSPAPSMSPWKRRTTAQKNRAVISDAG